MSIIKRTLKKVPSSQNSTISSGTEHSGAVSLLSEHRHPLDEHTVLVSGCWLSYRVAEALPVADLIGRHHVDEAEGQAKDCFRQHPEGSLVVKVAFWRQHLCFDKRILDAVLPLQVEAAR